MRIDMKIWMVLCAIFVGCSGEKELPQEDTCLGEGALATCLEAVQSPEYYIEQSSAYFDTMDYRIDLEQWPPYSELVARWEWPPWLKLTAFSQDNIETTDTFLQLYPSIVEERDCRFFEQQPFGRCTVVFYYDAHDGLGCPIYEEFTFNDLGEITFIEAWSDLDGYRPQADGDPWAENGIHRLSGLVPGLGTPNGGIDLDGDAMVAAMAVNEDVADFVYRAKNWQETWMEEYSQAGDDLWSVGCGWGEE
jgi:hypothetical protein